MKNVITMDFSDTQRQRLSVWWIAAGCGLFSQMFLWQKTGEWTRVHSISSKVTLTYNVLLQIDSGGCSQGQELQDGKKDGQMRPRTDTKKPSLGYSSGFVSCWSTTSCHNESAQTLLDRRLYPSAKHWDASRQRRRHKKRVGGNKWISGPLLRVRQRGREQ